MGPIDRFTDRAKRVLALAQDEAFRRFEHTYIGPEHLLIGLAREGAGVASRALAAEGVELQRLRVAVETAVGRGHLESTPDEIVLDPRTKHIIDAANAESRSLDAARTGTGHLLLALARDDDPVVTRIFESVAVSREKLRDGVLAAMAESRKDRADG